jgi:Bacterial conjugation TrbI-like protein
MDYQDHLPQDNSSENNAQSDNISSDHLTSDQIQDSQIQDQKNPEITTDSSGQQSSGIHDFVGMMGLELDEQDPVSAFHHHGEHREGDYDQEFSSFGEDALEAEVLEEGDGEFFNQEFNPEKNRTLVGLSGNGLAKTAVVIGGTLAILGGGASFFNGQIPKDKVAKVQKAKTPADEKVNAAESAATKAQQSESETKAELALSKQKDSLDQANKNDSTKAAADNKPTVGSTTPGSTATVATSANKSNPNTSVPVRTASGSPAVPVVPVLRPASSNRFASSTPVNQPAKKTVQESSVSNNSNSIASLAPKTIASAQLPSSAKASGSTGGDSVRANPLQAAVSRSLNQSSGQNTYSPTSFPTAGSGKKSAFSSAKRSSNPGMQPLATPGLGRLAPTSDPAPYKNIPNSFGNPATDSTTPPVLVASTTIAGEDNSIKNSTKTLSDYLSSKSAPPLQPANVARPQMQVATIPGTGAAPYANGFTSNNPPPPLFNPSTNSDPLSLASGIRAAQGTTAKPSLPAVSDIRSPLAQVKPSDNNVVASSGLPTLSAGINQVQSNAAKQLNGNLTPVNQVVVANQPQLVNNNLPTDGIGNPSGLLSLAAGIRMVQDLPVNDQSFQIASANIDTSLEQISVRPAFKQSQLIAFGGDVKSAKTDKADKVEALKPSGNNSNIAKSILVGTSAKGSTLTPILWNGGASSSAKFIIKLDEAIPDNSGQMALPSGSQLVVIAKTVSNSLALADLEVVSVVINGTEYTAPIGAITVRDDNNGLLIGEDYFRRNEQAASRDFLSILTGAVSGVGQALNRPTSTFSFNGLGGSTTISNQGQNLLGAALEGGFKDLPAIWTQRNQQALQEIASKPNVYQIPKGKAVRIFINRTIDF